MSTLSAYKDEKIIIEDLMAVTRGYTGQLMNIIGTATRNMPTNQVKKIIIPFHEFSEKNPITDEKTNIFSSIAVGFLPQDIRLFRMKYDIVVGYDDPRLPFIQQQFSNILADMNRMFESLLFTGINKEYGLQENSKLMTIPKTYRSETKTIDAFVSHISEEIENMVIHFGKSIYSLLLPMGWYREFQHVQGKPADQYFEESLRSRSGRIGITLNIYDCDLVKAVYVVRNDDISGYFGKMPWMSRVINDERKEEIVYRFSYDTPALVIGRLGSVRKLTGLIDQDTQIESRVNLVSHPTYTNSFAVQGDSPTLSKNPTKPQQK